MLHQKNALTFTSQMRQQNRCPISTLTVYYSENAALFKCKPGLLLRSTLSLRGLGRFIVWKHQADRARARPLLPRRPHLHHPFLPPSHAAQAAAHIEMPRILDIVAFSNHFVRRLQKNSGLGPTKNTRKGYIKIQQTLQECALKGWVLHSAASAYFSPARG